MAISNLDGLIAGLAQYRQIRWIEKNTLSNSVAGQLFSLWRATGWPVQPSAPTTQTVCSRATDGALAQVNASGGRALYLANMLLQAPTTAGAGIGLWDRLAHMGGLSGTSVAAQTVNVDVSGSSSNLVARRGATDYSDVRWFLEWYTDTGSTAVTANVDVTYNDNTTATIAVSLAATMRAGRLLPIIPTTAGKFIKSVQSVTLSASTLTAGNFGVTAARVILPWYATVNNSSFVNDWASLGLPKIEDDACLQLVALAGTTTTPTTFAMMTFCEG